LNDFALRLAMLRRRPTRDRSGSRRCVRKITVAIVTADAAAGRALNRCALEARLTGEPIRSTWRVSGARDR